MSEADRDWVAMWGCICCATVVDGWPVLLFLAAAVLAYIGSKDKSHEQKDTGHDH